MFTEKWKYFVTGALMVSMLAACTNGGTPSTEGTSKPGTSTSPTAKKDPVEVIFYSSSGDFVEESFMQMFGNKIKEKFPHVTPKFIPLSAANSMKNLLTTGQTLDIVYYSIGASTELVDNELQYDISDLIKKNNYDLSRLEPSIVENQRKVANGGLYGLPVFNNSMALFYNKDIFNKFGVSYPKDGMTWDDLYELTKVMSRADGATKYNGLTMSMTAARVLSQYSANYLDPVTNKSNFTSENFRKQLEQLTQFALIPGNTLTKEKAGLQAQIATFSKDQLSSMLLHFSVYGLTQFKDTINWDVASYPVNKDKPDVGPQAYPTYFYITKNSKVKDQAFEIIAYLTSDEFQKHLSRNAILPVLKNRDVALKELGQDVSYLKTKNVGAFLPKTFAPASIVTENQLKTTSAGNTPFINAYTEVVTGVSDVNTALRVADEKYAAEVAKILAPK